MCVLALVLCHLVPAACKDVSSSIRWLAHVLYKGLLLLYIACVLALVLGVIWCQSSGLKMCHLGLYISSCTLQGFVTTLHSVCACVLALVLGWMCHLVPAACKDVSSSFRWPLYKLMYFTRVCYYFT